MCVVLNVRAMCIDQLRQNRLKISRETGFMYMPATSQSTKLHGKTLLKHVNITKILVFHGCSHDVKVNVRIDARELINNDGMIMRTIQVAGIHVRTAARKRRVRSPPALP